MLLGYLFAFGEYDNGSAQPDPWLELEKVGVAHTYASFRGSGAYGFGKMGAVDSYVVEPRDTEPQEPGTVSTFYGTFPVVEVVGNVGRIQQLVDLEAAFGGFVVAPAFLVSVEAGTGNGVNRQRLPQRVNQSQAQLGLADDDEGVGISLGNEGGVILALN